MKNFYKIIYNGNAGNENNTVKNFLTKIKGMDAESYLQAIYNKADEYYESRLEDIDSADDYYKGLLCAVH